MYSIAALYALFFIGTPDRLKKVFAVKPVEIKKDPVTGREFPVRPAWLTYGAAAWNALLSAFSLWGCLRSAPQLLFYLATKDFRETVCAPPTLTYGHGAAGLAAVMFIVSKLPELVDTVILLLKGKPIIFLHWYHHCTVLAFCWHSYTTESANGLYFISMNYTVHSIMYCYYAMTELKCLPKWFPTQVITLMQIAQMLVGTFIVGMSIYYRLAPTPGTTRCHNDDANLLFGAVMYSSYFLLFVLFAIEKYGPGKKAKKA